LVGFEIGVGEGHGLLALGILGDAGDRAIDLARRHGGEGGIEVHVFDVGFHVDGFGVSGDDIGVDPDDRLAAIILKRSELGVGRDVERS